MACIDLNALNISIFYSKQHALELQGAKGTDGMEMSTDKYRFYKGDRGANAWTREEKKALSVRK